jgi:hypothetical protein
VGVPTTVVVLEGELVIVMVGVSSEDVEGAVVVGAGPSDASICDSAAVIMLSSALSQPRSLVWVGFRAGQVISLLFLVSGGT